MPLPTHGIMEVDEELQAAEATRLLMSSLRWYFYCKCGTVWWIGFDPERDHYRVPHIQCSCGADTKGGL